MEAGRAGEVAQGCSAFAIRVRKHGPDQTGGVVEAMKAAQHAAILPLDLKLRDVWELRGPELADVMPALDHLVEAERSGQLELNEDTCLGRLLRQVIVSIGEISLSAAIFAGLYDVLEYWLKYRQCKVAIDFRFLHYIWRLYLRVLINDQKRIFNQDSIG